MACVVGSALMGTISGSAIANVMATGPFTIPMMKERGYKPTFAAAVEAASSTGGQILPPVMGAGAFLMVAFTNTPFTTIALSALIPAILYFIGSGAAVIAQANILNIKVAENIDVPKAKTILKSDWLYVFIFVVLIYCMMVLRISPMRSALYSTALIPFLMLFDKKKRFKFKDIIPGMIKGSRNCVTVVIGIACAGIIVAVTAMTGLGVMFGKIMLSGAGGNLILALIFSAIACVILGLGLPTTSAYVVTASIIAPSLAVLGVPILTGHMFVFYFACLSAITPPVALAAYSAGALAKTNPMTTAIEACKLQIVAFFIPFAFVFSDALFFRGSLFDIATVFITAVLGTIIMSMGFQGWMMWRLNFVERILVIVSGAMLFAPFLVASLIGLCIAAVLIVINMKKWRTIHS
jgi:TRAP transporter 4TM/12TM fusion protein